MGSESPFQLNSLDMTYIPTNEWGKPNAESRLALAKAITFHAGYYIPKMYKDDCGMPIAFVVKMVDAIKKSFYTDNLAEDYLTDCVITVWREWISPYSAARPSARNDPSINYTDYLDSLTENPNLWKIIITVDELGVVACETDRKALVKAINFHVRRFIPISYKDYGDLPCAFIVRFMEALEENFIFDEVPEICYITDLVKAAWKRHKNELHKKYIKDKDPSTVKASSPSPFVSYEDWSQFVDMCTSSEYKAMCARNIGTRRKEEMPSTHDARVLTGVGTEKAKMGNCNFDIELPRTGAVTVHLTKKQKIVQCPDTNSTMFC